jgi:chromosome segregation ATPase
MAAMVYAEIVLKRKVD